MVKDPTTVVTRNGVALNPATLVVPGNYYEFNTNQGSGTSTASYIESDKPIMVAQYMISSDGTTCGVTAPGGDIGTMMPLLIGPIPTAVSGVDDHILVLITWLGVIRLLLSKYCNSCIVGNLQPP